jgi:hypothetical protein
MSKKLLRPWPLYDFLSQYTWNLYPTQIFYKCFGFCNLVCDGHKGQAWWCDLSLACCMSHTFDCAVLVLDTLIFLLYHVSSARSPSVSLCHKEQRVNDPGNGEKLCSGTELLHLKYEYTSSVKVLYHFFFYCCLSVHVDNYTIIIPTKCTCFFIIKITKYYNL